MNPSVSIQYDATQERSESIEYCSENNCAYHSSAESENTLKSIGFEASNADEEDALTRPMSAIQNVVHDRVEGMLYVVQDDIEAIQDRIALLDNDVQSLRSLPSAEELRNLFDSSISTHDTFVRHIADYSSFVTNTRNDISVIRKTLQQISSDISGMKGSERRALAARHSLSEELPLPPGNQCQNPDYGRTERVAKRKRSRSPDNTPSSSVQKLFRGHDAACDVVFGPVDVDTRSPRSAALEVIHKVGLSPHMIRTVQPTTQYIDYIQIGFINKAFADMFVELSSYIHDQELPEQSACSASEWIGFQNDAEDF